MSLLTPVRRYVDSLVHPLAQQDALTAARHRAFIAPRLVGSFAALAAIPVYLAVRGVPSALEILVFAWLVAPITIAYFLSRTGSYESAHCLSSLALTGLVTVIAARTGGISSFAAIWLVVVPLEAALSASRRVVALASTFALAAAALLLLLDGIGLTSPAIAVNGPATLAALGIISAALYATGLALGVESLARTGIWLLYGKEDRYRLLAHNMTDVLTRHGRHGAVLFVSPAAQPLLGVPVRGLLGHGLFDRVHVADRPAYLKALSDAAACGEAQSVEFRLKRELPQGRAHTDNPFIWVEMRCRPLEGAKDQRGGAQNEVVAVMRDISGHKNQEQALENARAESERANAAKGHFLATMSHELRTPLNVIIGFSDMLTKEGPLHLDAERRGTYAQLINESGRHLLGVVNGILDMSRIDSGNFQITAEPFAPDEAAATCCDLMTLKAGESGIELIRCIARDVPEINADKRAFNQILLNLLSNAIKFTDRGGRVSVNVFREQAMVAVVVEDSGIGIGSDDLPRLGDPFFQAQAAYDRRHDGTGLGLSIVRGLIDLHGGTLDIRSRPGVGTAVTVRLPIDCEQVRARDSAVAAPMGTLEVLASRRAGAPARKIA